MQPRKLLITLDIDYNKNITGLTYPYMARYAQKIGADFKVISTRKFPDQPINMEKFQLYQHSDGYDWTMFIDADALIHPNCPDLTEIENKDTVLFNSCDYYPLRFRANDYSRRDGRQLGAATWLTVFSDWTRDLWHPYDDPLRFVDQISPIHMELIYGYTPEHILDDYLVSRNIAKYGLKVKQLKHDFPRLKDNPNIFCHLFCVSEQAKEQQVRQYIETQVLTSPIPMHMMKNGMGTNH